MPVQAYEPTNYILRRKGGRSLLKHPPLFSPDGHTLFVISESAVRLYNVKTGECSRVLEREEGADGAGELLAIRLLAEEPHNLYGCCEKGFLTVWSWEAGGAVLRQKKLNLGENLDENISNRAKSKATILTFDMLEPSVCLVSALEKGSKKPFLVKYCLKTERTICEYNINIQHSLLWNLAVGWKYKHRFAAICDGSEKFYVYDLSRPKENCRVHSNWNRIRIVCIAAHPSDSCVVTGDALGRAIVWKGDLFGSSKCATEVLHWHTMPVFAVEFSVQGGYLLTGGLERVLVKWSLSSSAAPQQRETLPRLGGAVRHLATSVPHLAVVTNDNAIIITTPQLRVVSTIMECGGLSSHTRPAGAGLVYHQPLGALLLAGRPGHLQFLSTASDQLIYNVDITGLNMIPPSRLNPAPAETEVTCAAVSADGQWLVTSEYRADATNHPEERLKFWTFNTNAASPVTLNTCVNFSHGGCKVTAIVLNKTSDYTVTAGTDQKFRVWRKEFNLINKKRKVSWSCLTACYYAPGVGASLDQSALKNVITDKSIDSFEPPYLRENKSDFISEFLGATVVRKDDSDIGNIRRQEAIEAELELGGLAVSQDGSLIAAWFGSRLTLWDSRTCSLREVLSHPSLRPKGVDVAFGNDDASHYVVCTTAQCVAVWSLLSLCVRWLVHARPACLVADPRSNRMAVLTQNNDVFVFTPHQSTPLYSRRCVLDPAAGVLRNAAFGPTTRADFTLYLMRNDAELYTLERATSAGAPPETASRAAPPLSHYGALVAERLTTEVRARRLGALDAPVMAAPLTMFSAAPHMIASTGLLCTPFLQQLAGVTEEQTPEEVQLSSDESAGEESDEDQVSSAPKKVEFWKVDYSGVNEKRAKKILKKKLNVNLVKSLLDCKI